MRTDIKLSQKLLWPETNTISIHSLSFARASQCRNVTNEDVCSALYWGDKRSLAMAMCDVLTEAQLPATQLYTELSLTTPAWFSVMLSHRWLKIFTIVTLHLQTTTDCWPAAPGSTRR